MNNILIRAIQSTDNPALASLVKDTLAEFGANKPDTAYFDPSTDILFEIFQKPRSVYNVAEINGEIIGGAGVYPTDGLDSDTCELVKMYLRPHARGLGLAGY
jgi:putative acetyltransferase